MPNQFLELLTLNHNTFIHPKHSDFESEEGNYFVVPCRPVGQPPCLSAALSIKPLEAPQGPTPMCRSQGIKYGPPGHRLTRYQDRGKGKKDYVWCLDYDPEVSASTTDREFTYLMPSCALQIPILLDFVCPTRNILPTSFYHI